MSAVLAILPRSTNLATWSILMLALAPAVLDLVDSLALTAMEARSALLAHLAKSQYSKPFSTLFDVKEFVERCYPSLDVEMVNIGNEKEGDAGRWIIVLSGKYVTLLGSCLGPMKPAHMVFNESGQYSIEVLLTAVNTGSWKESVPPHSDICSRMDSFLLILANYDRDFKEIIRFQADNFGYHMLGLH